MIKDVMKSTVKKAVIAVFFKVGLWVIPVIIAVVLISKAYTFGTGLWSCSVDWKESGMDYKYKFGAGCMISPTDGNWIPAKNYRIN